MRIYLTVAGAPTTALDQGALSWQRSGDAVTFTLPIKNTGNTILYSTASLSVKSANGTTAELAFSAPESILPGSSLNLEATLSPAAFIQLGGASATLLSDAGSVQITTTFNDVPWWIVLIVLVLVALVVLGVWRGTLFVRRARRAIAQVAQVAPLTPLNSAEAAQPTGAARPAEAVNDVAAPAVSDGEEQSLRPRRSRR